MAYGPLRSSDLSELCLYFGTKKYIGFFDEQKKENKVEMNSIDDIFNFSDLLNSAVDSYDKSKEQNPS